ncbi:MAG: hypothetical protein ACKOWP_03520 [Microbacteriaceae bacterium]
MTTPAARFAKNTLSEITSLFNGTVWPITLGLMLVLTLLSTGLGLGEGQPAELGSDFDPGRNATALTALVALVLGVISGPVVMNSARKDDRGPAPLGMSVVIAVIVGGSLVLAALPALLWGFANSTLDMAELFALVATLKFEVLALTLISALIHVAIVRRTLASVVGGAIVLAITVVPAGVSEVAATINGVEQVETYIGVEWTEETTTDPKTGLVINPVCSEPNTMTTWKADASHTWQVLAISPLVTLAESIPASITSDDGYYTGQPEGVVGPERYFPSDTLSALSTQFRMAQKPVPTAILRDECEAMENGYALPYDYPGEVPLDWENGTTSGYGIGLLVQSGALVVVAGIATAAHLSRRRKG